MINCRAAARNAPAAPAAPSALALCAACTTLATTGALYRTPLHAHPVPLLHRPPPHSTVRELRSPRAPPALPWRPGCCVISQRYHFAPMLGKRATVYFQACFVQRFSQKTRTGLRH